MSESIYKGGTRRSEPATGGRGERAFEIPLDSPRPAVRSTGPTREQLREAVDLNISVKALHFLDRYEAGETLRSIGAGQTPPLRDDRVGRLCEKAASRRHYRNPALPTWEEIKERMLAARRAVS